MVSKERFYQLQKERKLKNFYVLMLVPIMFSIGLIVLLVFIILEYKGFYTLIRDKEMRLILYGIASCFLMIGGLAVFLLSKYEQVKKNIYKVYESRLPQTKELIEKELKEISRVCGIEFGEEGMYFNDRSYLGFTNYVPYNEIVWCYLQKGNNGLSVQPGWNRVMSEAGIGSIVVYTKDGRKHFASDTYVQRFGEIFLKDLMNNAKTARYGYSKENKLWWKNSFR